MTTVSSVSDTAANTRLTRTQPGDGTATAVHNPVPAARWRLHWQVSRTVHWPDYEGSALRGLFGHALRQLACSTGQPACTGCPLLQRCAYPALFAPPPATVTHRPGAEPAAPWVLQPLPGTPRLLPPGSVYSTDLVLIGPAISRHALVLAAWQRALADHVGPQRGAAQWLGADAPSQLGVALPSANAAPAAVTVVLRTPLRIKRGGEVLRPAALQGADWLFALVRRAADVCELQLQQPSGFDFPALKRAAQAVQTLNPQLHWQAGQRWSNRQQQHTPLDGVVGRVTLTGDLRPFWPLLHLGQWLHVGGKTSFGLGGYGLADESLPVAGPPGGPVTGTIAARPATRRA